MYDRSPPRVQVVRGRAFRRGAREGESTGDVIGHDSMMGLTCRTSAVVRFWCCRLVCFDIFKSRRRALLLNVEVLFLFVSVFEF